jgi:transcriptional regulator with XRE-family HTH domain
MASKCPYLRSLLQRLKELREQSGLSQADLEERLILGPGWVDRFEAGESVPTLDLLLSMLHAIGKNLSDLLKGTADEAAGSGFQRQIYAENSGNDLVVHFNYADFDATYVLPNATRDQFDLVIKTLRDGLARLAVSKAALIEAIKKDAVASAFLAAARIWPQANPSDLWWFLIYRAYCDPYNHPGQFARLDFAQSWKRTGGWALEEVLVRHYGPYLESKGVRLFIASSEIKERLLRSVRVRDRLEADKIDVVLTTATREGEKLLGVVHVKASIAERRTDDVPMSRTLIKAGCVSPLWTMDCKSMPGERPANRGELGSPLQRGADERSAKRKDIEKDGYFSACFSYNANTIPTARGQKAKARIYVCNFRNPDDSFSRFILERRRNLPSP